MEAFEAKVALAAVDDLLIAAREYLTGKITLDQATDMRREVKARVMVLARREGSNLAAAFRAYLSA